MVARTVWLLLLHPIMNQHNRTQATLARSRWFAGELRNLVVLGTAVGLLACGQSEKSGSSGASNELLIVGYDREPDTMNRYATHILEDIQSCVIEGLVTNDETMQIVPVLAREIPTVENGGVVLRPDGGMDVVWKLRAGVKWHDGAPHTSRDVQFTVNAINKGDWKPESVDGFDRIASVDTPDSSLPSCITRKCTRHTGCSSCAERCPNTCWAGAI